MLPWDSQTRRRSRLAHKHRRLSLAAIQVYISVCVWRERERERGREREEREREREREREGGREREKVNCALDEHCDVNKSGGGESMVVARSQASWWHMTSLHWKCVCVYVWKYRQKYCEHGKNLKGHLL